MRGEREKREDVRRSAERTRKTEKTELSWPARMKEAAKVSKISSPLKNDNLGGKAVNFFFTNFPEYWETTELWQEFRKIGTTVDVFVARKRNKLGRKFGFARFLRVLDVGELTEALNNLWLDKFKLKANLAKYRRKEVKEKPTKMKIAVIGPSTTISDKPSTSRDDGESRSYKEAVNGSQPLVKKHVNTEPEPEIDSIQVIPSPDSLERLDRSLFGEVRCLELLKNFQELSTIESLNDVKVSYFGGLAVLLEFRTKIAAKNYLIRAKNTWSKWFRALDCWSPEVQPMKRFAYLNIMGLPPHAWVPNAFSDIGGMWGDIVIPEWCNKESQNRERGKVIILTQNFNIINDTVEVNIKGVSYRIMVVENFKESGKIGPNFPAHPQNFDGIKDDNLIDSDQSRCDEYSDFEFDGDDLDLDGEEASEHPHDDVVVHDAAVDTVDDAVVDTVDVVEDTVVDVTVNAGVTAPEHRSTGNKMQLNNDGDADFAAAIDDLAAVVDDEVSAAVTVPEDRSTGMKQELNNAVSVGIQRGDDDLVALSAGDQLVDDDVAAAMAGVVSTREK
ncbi:hypothetical protein LXL04_039662 [Taraxacum kok-saghyz]